MEIPQKLTALLDAYHAAPSELHATSYGTSYNSRPVHRQFHPLKHAATCEGGGITTGSDSLARRMRVSRSHGIISDHRTGVASGAWLYDTVDPENNYRLTDMHCALGVTQLGQLEANVARRQQIAARYDQAFASDEAVVPLARRDGFTHVYHLYVVRLQLALLRADWDAIMAALRAKGIGVNLHYRSVYLHPYYRDRGFRPGLCPNVEQVFEKIVTLPLFPTMAESDVDDVISAVQKVLDHNRR